MLMYILQKIIPQAQKSIIFVPTRHHVEFIAELLKACSFTVSSIFGTMDQVARKANVEVFRSGQSNILIVTDLAARGIGNLPKSD
jgi:ATP-dependent RNA helicase DDX54/DBP10